MTSVRSAWPLGGSPGATRRNAALLLAATVAIPATVIAFLLLSQAPESLSAGDRIRPIVAADLDGRPVVLRPKTSDGRAQVWLVVSASCPLCRQEIGDVEREELPSRVTVVSLSSLQATRALMRPFPRLQARTVVDTTGALEHTYGRFRFPTTLVVDVRGIVLRKSRGILWRSVAPPRGRNGDVAQ